MSTQLRERIASDPALAARYGIDRRRPWLPLLVSLIVVVYVGGAIWAAVALSRHPAEGNVVSWSAAPRATTVTLEVRGAGTIECVLKATDDRSTDVGYRHYTIERAPATVEVTLPTVIQASSVAVLGCAPAGEQLQVPGPDFPPGVTIPH